MSQDLERCVIRILNQYDATVGTGFVVADGLAVTCAHVVKAAGSDKDELIFVQFYADESQQIAQVLTEGWSPPEADDVAFLQLDYLPEGVVPVVLGSAKQCQGHLYHTLGFARLAGYDNRHVTDTLDGVVSVRDKHKRPMLQLKGEEIDQGLSGSPVLDAQTDRVVGMVSEYQDNARTRFAWATTSDTLSTLNPALQLWPNTYGPDELNAYLDYLIDANQTLILPDGNEVQLERVYVSLRADEMNARDRQAEYNLYLEDVAALQKLPGAAGSDEYARFAAMRKVVARRPRMLMLKARDWESLFGVRTQGLLSLAEVVQRNPYVVLLGDPGSGKTTLGKWLVLQFARAFRQGATHVKVQADLVRPGDEYNKLVDLGPVTLPILIRIADYARVRWDKEQGDSRISLEAFLGFRRNQQNLPSKLTSEAADAIIREYLMQGRALIVLDGLDEVGDPDQRKAVMQAVRKFLQAQPPVAQNDEWTGNHVVLTSRIVGYQFDPLTHLPHYTVEDMDETAISAFCKAWMMHVAKAEDAAEQAQELKDAIFSHGHPGVRTLAGNPLLLTILAQVYWNSAERKLPALRVDLFEAATQALYDQRRDFWRQVGMTLEDLVQALGAVAAYIHAHEVTGFAEEGTVKAQLNTVLKDWRQVRAVLEVAREVSGFLVARGEGVYGFLHRSLQEYFAAQHLTRQYEQVVENLINRVLDPIWREPVSLAIGIASQPGYPESRRILPEVFAALLDMPDPAGEFLPRRELLATAACAECERVPPRFSQRIAQNLLFLYAQREGRGRSPVLRARIRRAFAVLHDSYAREDVETVLCAAVQHSDLENRYAAIDLIIETQWSSPAIARALLKAWQTYPDPAASLLIAIDDVSSHNPASTQENALLLRQVMGMEPLLWERLRASEEWQVVIRTLYLPQDADFAIDQINRDSPLTEQILSVLRSGGSVAAFRQRLVHQACQPGTPLARDAALVLSALDDASWVGSCVTNSGEQESKIRPIVACFTRDLALARALASDHALALARFLDSARTYINDHTLAFAGDRAHALARDLDLAQGMPRGTASDRELSLIYELARSQARALAEELDLAHDSELSLNYERARARLHALAEEHDLSRELARAFQIAEERERARKPEREPVREREPRRTFKSEAERKRALDRALFDELKLACDHDLTQAPELARDLQQAFERIRRLVFNDIPISKDEVQSARKLLERERAFSRKRALDRALFDELKLACDHDLTQAPELARDLQQAFERIREFVRKGISIPEYEIENARELLARERAFSRKRERELSLERERELNLVLPLIHDLALDRAFIDELDLARTRDLARVPGLTEALEETRARIREYTRKGDQIPEHEREFVRELRARERELTNELELARLRSRAFERAVAGEFNLALIPVFVHALVQDEELAAIHTRVHTCINSLTSELIRIREQGRARGLVLIQDLARVSHRSFEHSEGSVFDRDLANIYLLYHGSSEVSNAGEFPQVHTVASDLDRARAHELALDLALDLDPTRASDSTFARMLSRDNELALIHNLARTRASALARAHALVLSLVRARELDLAQNQDIKFDPASVRDLVLARNRALEVERSMQKVSIPSSKDDPTLVWLINSIYASIQTIRRLVDFSTAVTRVGASLTALYRERWLVKTKPPVVSIEVDQVQMTPEVLTTLLADLACPNDVRREYAQKVMSAERPASKLGEAAVERMAELVLIHSSRAGTKLEWVLQTITHDQPSWIVRWIKQTEEDEHAAIPPLILGNMMRITTDAFVVLLNALPSVEPRVNTALLESLIRMSRNGQIPDERQNDLQKKLLNWLVQEADPDICRAILEVLGCCQDDSGFISQILLARLSGNVQMPAPAMLYEALARLAARQSKVAKPAFAALQERCPHPAASAALARLSLMEIDRRFFYEAGQRKHLDAIGTSLLSKLSEVSLNPVQCLMALLDAGTDSDPWNEKYHGILVNAIRIHVERYRDLLIPALLTYTEQTLLSQNWSARRMALAAVATCIEVMPAAVQEAYPGSLEDLFVRGTIDAESHTSRRFALTALSYLRTITPKVVPALLAGCQDIQVVQHDAIAAAGRFQSVEGNLLPTLIAELRSESRSTAYAVAQLLGALGTSLASGETGLQGQIIEALVDALKDPASQREVIISNEHKGKLEDTLYTVLLQVAG